MKKFKLLVVVFLLALMVVPQTVFAQENSYIDDEIIMANLVDINNATKTRAGSYVIPWSQHITPPDGNHAQIITAKVTGTVTYDSKYRMVACSNVTASYIYTPAQNAKCTTLEKKIENNVAKYKVKLSTNVGSYTYSFNKSPGVY